MNNPYYQDDQVTLYHGDALDVLAELPDRSVDAVVCDPPYNLSFMAKTWDALDGREDAGFAYWLAGLIDGEGCFTIKAHTRGTHAPSFAIKLRADDVAVLEHARRTLGAGTVTIERRAEGNDMARWVVGDKAGCQRLVDLLDKYPLRAKKRIDYWTWREAVCEWTGRGRGNRWHGAADNERMAALRERLMSGRAYTDIAWSGNEFQDWCRLWAAECLRVLKPGGHMLAFGGSRTWHRLASAIEDAGFEVRDSIAWLYGCLTADTEVLTDSGWKLGIDVTEGDLVAQWDSETDQITLAPVQQVFRAPWDGPMRILRNADTDQVLTPNHRVYHRPAQRKMVSGKRRRWFDNQWQVAEAADLSTWNPVQLPVAGHHEGSGIGGDDYAALLGWVWTEGGFDPSGTGVRIYQSSVNADKVAEIAALMDRIGAHKRYDRERTYRGRVYTETMWFISGELAERVRADLPGKRPTYDLLWRMTGSEKMSLLRAAMLGDGSGWGTRSQQFHQKYEDDLVWLQTLLALIGRSGKVGMRPDRQCGALYLRDRATTELQARHLRDDTEHYTGEVWCVKVPTGAFVARRNGKVFITGNSGFPKSLDVSKAIDKAAGAEREVIGTRRAGITPSGGLVRNGVTEADKQRLVTAPSTDAAKQWQGWGTALKPAFEPIVVARKPLVGTVAANVLEHGTGALNIDACRVGTADKLVRPEIQRHDNEVLGKGLGAGTQVEPGGRWPTNVVLDDTQAAELDAQSGIQKSGTAVQRNGGGQKIFGGIAGGENSAGARPDAGYNDEGGASRFFPVFKYQAKAPTRERPGYVNEDGAKVAHNTVKPLDLMRWLVRLVTPPNGVVLDPFAGSGTTAEACIHEHKRCITIEREADYLPLIVNRLSKPIEVGFDFGDAAS
ncbi:DNA methylase [Mycobacterium phage Akhila]|nr:DNA methylase [Mycobacterium phage Akhila]UAJ16668.1 DNA methylase [Mycobacterium phage MilanaBonita]